MDLSCAVWSKTIYLTANSHFSRLRRERLNSASTCNSNAHSLIRNAGIFEIRKYIEKLHCWTWVLVIVYCIVPRPRQSDKLQGHQSLWWPENKNVFKYFSQMMFKATTEAKAQGQLFKKFDRKLAASYRWKKMYSEFSVKIVMFFLFAAPFTLWKEISLKKSG